MDMRYRKLGFYLAIGLGGLVNPLATGSGRAEAEARPGEAKPDALTRALGQTTGSGRPTVLVVTSASHPDTQVGWQAVKKLPRFQEMSRAAQFIELNAGSDEAAMSRFGIKSFPAVRVFRKGPEGVVLAASQDGLKDAYALVGWLATVGIDAVASSRDPSLMQANYPTPSAQNYSAPPPAAPAPPPPFVPAAPAPPTTVNIPVSPVYSSPAPSPVVLSAPSTPVVFQPQASQIVVGPTPPPNIFIASSPATPPNITMMSPAAPANAPQLMLGVPTSSPAPPLTVALAPAVAPAVAPAPSQAGPASTALGYVLTNPGFLDRLLGAIGRLLVTRSYPRIQMAPAMPATFGAPAQLIPAPAYLAQPVQAPAAAPPAYLLQEAPKAAPPAPPKVPEGPTASPQCVIGSCGHPGHGGAPLAAPRKSRFFGLTR